MCNMIWMLPKQPKKRIGAPLVAMVTVNIVNIRA